MPSLHAEMRLTGWGVGIRYGVGLTNRYQKRIIPDISMPIPCIDIMIKLKTPWWS